MTQQSILWPTSGVGDGAAAYTATQLATWLKGMLSSLSASNTANHGIFPHSEQGTLQTYGPLGFNTGVVASPVAISTGSALVNGIFYNSDAIVSVTVPTPSVGAATGKQIVLRADYTAQTIRVTLLTSADGTATIPALTQNASFWDLPIMSFTISNAGVISGGTLTDLRVFVPAPTRFYAGPGIPGTNSTGSVSTYFMPTSIQLGTASGTGTITYPKAFFGAPMVFTTQASGGTLTLGSVTSTNFVTTGTATFFNWMAIGALQ